MPNPRTASKGERSTATEDKNTRTYIYSKVYVSRMAANVFLRRSHRVIAVLFLVSIPPAAFFSATGSEVSPVVYLPLFPLFGLILTGGYLLVRPWVRQLRARRTPRGS